MNRFKMSLFLLVCLIVGVVGAIIAVGWMLIAIIFAPNGTRAWNIAQALDRLGNATTGGDGKETISARAGRLMTEKGWACYLCRFLDWLKERHCEDSAGIK